MSTDAALALSVDGLTVAYESEPVLWDVSFGLEPGSLSAIVGPNGAGKSTLLKSILGIQPRLAGNVRCFGEELDSARRRVAYMPQSKEIDWDFPTSVLDLVLMGSYGKLGWFKRAGKAERDRAIDALKEVQILDLADRQISELSGGQRQRAFIARAFMQEADLYLMDEPLAGVDAPTEREVMALLKGLRDRGNTLLVVHHDLTTVGDYFDHALLLNRRAVAYGVVGDVCTDERIEETYRR